MRWPLRLHRMLPAVATMALVAAACNSSSTTSAGGGSKSPMPSMSERSMSPMPSGTEQMAMQPGADKLHVTITSPAPGFTLTSNTLTLHVQATGYKPSCDYAGKQDMPGIGHYHVLLDGSLINMFCTTTAKISMQNVSPGSHTIEVVPAQDDHTEIVMNADKMPFTYQPTSPLPTIAAAPATGTPAIQILEPTDGATLSGAFTVKVAVTNYNLACNLMGKPDVQGYGHWHANIDSMSGPMMGMGTMLGMSCTDTFIGTTKGLTPGSTHTLIALLTDNGHAPIDVVNQITFTVGS